MADPIQIEIVESPDINATIQEGSTITVTTSANSPIEVTVEEPNQPDVTVTIDAPPEIEVSVSAPTEITASIETPPEILVQIMEAGESTGISGWTTLKDSWTTAPSFLQSIAAGDVYEYQYGSTTYYRLVPSPYDSTLDQFFSSFSNPTLSGLLATRGVAI